MPPRQIIAIGGGGFSAGSEGLAIDRYILAQARKPEPAVAFLATASGDAPSYIVRFYSAFAGLPCQPSHLSFFDRTPDLRSYLLAQDVIYVGGGNTKSMLAVWRDWGLPELLREAWAEGIVLAGTSAGANCWFEQGVADAYADRMSGVPCLGLLPGSCCPHFSSEAARRPAYHDLLLKQEIKPGIALDDAAAVRFVDHEIQEVVASQPGATAYRLTLEAGSVKEEALAARVLS